MIVGYFLHPSGRYFMVFSIISSASFFTSSTDGLWPFTSGSFKNALYTSSRSQVRAACKVYSWFSTCGFTRFKTPSGRLPAISGLIESRLNTALVSTTALAGRFGI